MRPSLVVRVMLMKMLAPFSDEGSTPSSSTRAAEDGTLGVARRTLKRGQDTADYFCFSDGAVKVSTGLRVGIGDIRKAISVTKQIIIAKPMAMAAAA